MLISFRFVGTVLLGIVGLSGCSSDMYRTQSDLLELHGQKFESFLHREQVEGAMHENQAIELIGLQIKSGRLPGSDRLKPQDLERQTQLLDTVRERAAVNWVALAQYFSSRQQYGAARALYQRVIQSYGRGGDRLYSEYAKQALADMDILVMGHRALETPVSNGTFSALQDNRHP